MAFPLKAPGARPADRPVERNERAARRLIGAAAISSLGDGVHISAAALLAASWSHDPFTVGLVATAATAAPLLTSLPSGIIADRADRRRVMIAADLVSAIVVAGLALAVATGLRSLLLLAVVAALLDATGTCFRAASAALVPTLADDDRALDRLNGRLATVDITALEFVGPPLGGVLFAIAPALPFVFDTASFVAGGAVLHRLPERATPLPADSPSPRPRWRSDVASGFVWLRGNVVAQRLIGLSMLSLFGSSAWLGVFVLFARERLGVAGAGFGLLMTAMAVGSLVASTLLHRFAAPHRRRCIVITALLIDAAGALALAQTRSAVIAATALAFLAAGAGAWSLVTLSARQRLIPDELRGRVGGATLVGTMTACTLGGLTGAVLAAQVSLAAPFVLAAALTAAGVVVARGLAADLTALA